MGGTECMFTSGTKFTSVLIGFSQFLELAGLANPAYSGGTGGVFTSRTRFAHGSGLGITFLVLSIHASSAGLCFGFKGGTGGTKFTSN
tara:strand:+ start:221 stop:484 length:264 start_codon:yes stop_codon:yes gene_type:complete